ncbi:hypothetical protein HHI36_018680 [Cryptolaemus montrouzieri]|uniref:Uncharacterized protein n=1 Tax=Cryptolaemus montrouzieri TaxID=559131 RepID=A0ABD2P0T2_9CUCU
MYLIQVIICSFCFVVFANSSPTRILVSCDRNGFTCKTIDSKRHILYQCPPKTQDVLINLWNYGEPSNTAWVTVKNCATVEIDMSCTSYRRSFESLTIENVTNLHFTRSVTTMKNPAKIYLRDIENIPLIPENTFTIPHMMKYNGPVVEHEVQGIEFESVNIGTIETHAFHGLRGFRNFTWKNVNVELVHPKAITINFNTTEKYQGWFSMTNSTMTILDYLSFQLHVKEAIFENNKFVEIMPGGISGTIENFTYVDNIVDMLQPGSISILAKTVNIFANTFNYLKAGSLSKISPGLLTDSHTSFGNLEFGYKFNNNNIVYMDAGSLNPDMVAYKKVSTNLYFTFNNFFCTCENMGWLISPNGHGSSTTSLKSFYESITNETASNICSGLTCKMTIASLKYFFKNGQCISNFTMEDFCQITTTSQTSTFEVDSIGESDIWYNRSEPKSDGNSNFSYYYIISFSVMLNMFSLKFVL